MEKCPNLNLFEKRARRKDSAAGTSGGGGSEAVSEGAAGMVSRWRSLFETGGSGPEVARGEMASEKEIQIFSNNNNNKTRAERRRRLTKRPSAASSFAVSAALASAEQSGCKKGASSWKRSATTY